MFTLSVRTSVVRKETEYVKKHGVVSLHVKTGNITKCGWIEKGFSTLWIEYNFEQAIKQYFSNVQF